METMKLSILLLLPAASFAFAPVRVPALRTLPKPSIVVNRNELDDACDKVTETTEDVLKKADDIVLSRFMRLLDHVPILFTLKGLTDKAGMACCKWSVNTNPSAFTGLSTALAVPAWCYNVWAVAVVAQIASVAKSALAEDNNELSQADITTTAAANFAATRAIGSSMPLLDTGVTALVSGYALRKNNQAGDVTIHNAAMQLVSSFTTVLTVLGLVSAICSRIPVLSDCSDGISLLGVAAFYIMATRGGNGTAKKAVNAGVIGGILYARIVAGVSFELTFKSFVSGMSLLGTAYVAFEAINRLRKAIFD